MQETAITKIEMSVFMSLKREKESIISVCSYWSCFYGATKSVPVF